VLVAIAVMVLPGAPSRPHPQILATATPRNRVLTPTALPATPAATATPTLTLVEHRSVVVPWNVAAATAAVNPTTAPTPYPSPTPTARPSECVEVRWSASTIGARFGEILVDVDAANRCGRDLDAMTVWFQVAGYRQGALVQSVRGHLFDPLRSGDDGHATIVLPGSLDWYDRVDVTVLDPYDP
jgi:hypothetical protein